MEKIITFKILMIGDTSAGKTELLHKYTESPFSNIISTLGVEYKTKFLTINNIDICLEILDNSGQERYRSLNKSYIRGVQGIMFVYDITNYETFSLIKYFQSDINLQEDKIKEIIVGNNCEQDYRRKVSKKSLQEFCFRHKIEGIEVSSKTGENVSKSFEILTKSIMGNKSKKDLINLFGIKNQNTLILSKKKRSKNKLLDKKLGNQENKKEDEIKTEILKEKDILDTRKQKNYSTILLNKYINY